MVDKKLDRLLDIMVELGGSDLHLKTDAKPRSRISGDITVIDEEILGKHFFEESMDLILSAKQRKILEEEKELDGYYVSRSEVRFRFNIFLHLNGYAFVFRIIPTKILTIDELNLPKSVNRLSEFERGLILVTGTTGSGKSTTLAAIIDAINTKKKKHIITIEDPVEFVHHDKNCIIEQRNVGEHTHSFHNALKSALREDPDIILVGEMRDVQTVEIALHAANSGHLVLSTLHTLDTKETLDRIIGIFPPHEQNRIRMTLASVIQGILSQRLIKKVGGGRNAAVEILISTDRIKQLILEKRDSEIIDAVEAGAIYGMQSFDQALFKLYKSGLATLEEVLIASTKPDDLKLMISNSEQNSLNSDEVIGFKEQPLEEQSGEGEQVQETQSVMPELKIKR
jgi:twitching motility protein PilT